VPGTVALPVLLSRVLGGFTAELEEPDDGVSSLAMWSNVLRGIGDGCSEGEVAQATSISKRLAIAGVTVAARVGLVTRADGPRGRRAVALTDRGRHAAAVWLDRLAELDGDSSQGDLRTALEAVVGRLTLELPHFPASYGSADPSVLGGGYVAARPDLDLPAHGQDWSPVLRGEGDTVSTVPLTGLLSQALVAFSIDYEATPTWPLATMTLIVQHLPTKPKPLAGVDADHGITGEGKSLLERHGIAVTRPDPTNPKQLLVELTKAGAWMKSHHKGFIADVEADWRTRFGAGVVDALRAELEAHPHASDTSLPDHLVASRQLG
jgi:hypothetical protein